MEGGNRREARAVLRDAYPKWNPLLQMAEAAQGLGEYADLPLADRLQMAKEINAYLVPKMRSVEVTGQGGGPIQINLVAPGDASL